MVSIALTMYLHSYTLSDSLKHSNQITLQFSLSFTMTMTSLTGTFSHHSVMSNSLQSHGLYNPWNSPGQNTGMGSCSHLQGSSQPRGQTHVSPLQADSLPVEPPENQKNTGVGSLSLLQQIFLTQELIWGLLHEWQIFYQLSYQEMPNQPPPPK